MPDWVRQLVMPLIMALSGAFTGAIKHIWNKQKAQAEQQEALKDCLIALTYDRITSFYSECEGKGYADIHDREKMEVLYNPYHKLGGNSTGTDCYERLKNLPMEPSKMTA